MKNRLGILGYPLDHTLSPIMQNAALKQVGMESIIYETLEKNYQELQVTIEDIKNTFLGINVTIPYKEKIMPWMDEITHQARLAGAVNTIRVMDGRLIGTNTDGLGYMKSLKEKGIDVAGRNILLLGSGGAARGVATALVQAKVHRIDVCSRKKAKGKALLDILQSIGGAPGSWIEFKNLIKKDLGIYHLIINTTPIGMYPHDAETLALPYDCLKDNQILSDLIYRPLETPFLLEGKRRGLQTINGLDMLLYQGAASFEFWLDQEAPVEAMRRSLMEALNQLS